MTLPVWDNKTNYTQFANDNLTPIKIVNFFTDLLKTYINTSISPIVEFLPTYTLHTDGEEKNIYNEGAIAALKANNGIYIFYDSMGNAIYVGKTEKQSLYKEICLVLQRNRKNLQTIFRVKHPERNQKFDISKKRNIIEDKDIFLEEMAYYFSAYKVENNLISIVESLLIRGFPNNIVNKRMEKGILISKDYE